MTHPSDLGPTVLVVAKAPVPGLAKTRVARDVGEAVAADLAAAALLDTLDAACASGLPVLVSMTGDVEQAARADEIAAALATVDVVPQVGDSFAERLVRAHRDADRGHGVVQVGMDSPQVTAADFLVAAAALDEHPSVLGPAEDGGWWLLGVRSADAVEGLAAVEMSTPTTGDDTRAVLPQPVRALRPLRDVDTWADALVIADDLPISRFAEAVRRVEVPA